MEFEKPVYNNDWECVTVIWKGDKVRGTGRAKIRWPNGEVQAVDILIKLRHGSYYDHGQSRPTSVTSRVPYFKAGYNGYTFDVPLQDVEVGEFVPDNQR